jgi:hypothetical protein
VEWDKFWVDILHDIDICFIAFVPARAEALPLILAPPAKKGKHGSKAPRKTGTARAPCSASGTGRGQKSTKAMADQALVNVGVGTSDELPLVLRQSFKDGRYSPSTRMEEVEWKIMLMTDIHMLHGAFSF